MLLRVLPLVTKWRIPDSVLHTIALFQKEGRQRSAAFAYWASFLEAGDILLWLLRADREANVLMHVEAVKETVLYFVLAGRTNYADTRQFT